MEYWNKNTDLRYRDAGYEVEITHDRNATPLCPEHGPMSREADQLHSSWFCGQCNRTAIIMATLIDNTWAIAVSQNELDKPDRRTQ